MHRLLGIAVFPARIREANPLPRGFLPKAKSDKAKTHLYPAEDAVLLGCGDVELGYRVLFGFMAREGTRRSEAKSLRWGGLDLTRGVLTLDENKTNDPRSWALDPGVLEAMGNWWRLRSQSAKETVGTHPLRPHAPKRFSCPLGPCGEPNCAVLNAMSSCSQGREGI